MQNQKNQIQVDEIISQDKKAFPQFQYIKKGIHTLQNRSRQYLTQTLNNNNQFLLVGFDSNIMIFQFRFKDGQIKLIKTFAAHSFTINCLYIMKHSDSLISACRFGTIKIWQKDRKNLWSFQRLLPGHENQIVCLVVNQNEDLIISGGTDKTIIFWSKNKNWQSTQTISLKDHILSLSLNNSGKKLVVMGKLNCIMIVEIVENTWKVTQKILTNRGSRLCFISNDAFVFIPDNGEQLIVYEYNILEKEFQNSYSIEMPKVDDQNFYFPSQFMQQRGIFMIKLDNVVYLFQRTSNNLIKLIQTIMFKTNYIYGSISQNEQFLITFDECNIFDSKIGSNQIQVRMLKNMM